MNVERATLAENATLARTAENEPTHHAAFHSMTLQEQDALTAPMRNALESFARQMAPIQNAMESVTRQTAPMRNAMEAFTLQTAPMRNALESVARQTARQTAPIREMLDRFAENQNALKETMRKVVSVVEKAQRVEAAVIAATPLDRRPEMRRVLRSLTRTMPLATVEEALAALHDYLTADTFGRLFPEGRAWGMAWTLSRVMRGESVDIAALPLIALDRNRIAPTTNPSATSRTPAPCRTYGERRERYRRRPAHVLSTRIAAHAPPRCRAYTGGESLHLVRQESATA